MLTARKTTMAMTNDGIVVIIIFLICAKSGVPDDDDARTVVSESGDTLSPK